MLNQNTIRHHLLNIDQFDQETLDFIEQEKWLKCWIPKKYDGLGFNLSEGLKLLQSIAKIDGSLGWFVTLCSGANYFSRNLKPEIAKQLFDHQHSVFGGSGMLNGTAEKIGNRYLINGIWHYATGAPYLTHVTLNAQLTENGQLLIEENGSPKFLSFILDYKQVEFIPTWKSMGMQATASHSFEVKNQYVADSHSFQYNVFYSDDLLDQIPFQIFADLTLFVNYLGMGEHFLEESSKYLDKTLLLTFDDFLKESTSIALEFAVQIEQSLTKNLTVSEELAVNLHQFCVQRIQQLTQHIISIYPLLSIKASKLNEELNQIFRDYFTATQHKNFRN